MDLWTDINAIKQVNSQKNCITWTPHYDTKIVLSNLYSLESIFKKVCYGSQNWEHFQAKVSSKNVYVWTGLQLF